MAWSEEEKALDAALAADIGDWGLLYASAKSQIIDWILTDRRIPKHKQAGRLAPKKKPRRKP